MFGGMAALPGSEWADGPTGAANAIGTVRHVFTHFSLDMQVVPRSAPVGEGWWCPIDQLHHAGLPTLYRRATELVLGEHQHAA
jgi:A/G-specific adenine glycosylase